MQISSYLTQLPFVGPIGLSDMEYFRHLGSGATSSNAAAHMPESKDPSLSASAYTCSHGQPTPQPCNPSTAGAPSPILELVLQGKPVAVAVKQQHQPASHPVNPAYHSAQTGSQQASTWQSCDAKRSGTEKAQAAEKPSGPWTCIYALDGSLLATEQEGHIYKGGAAGPHTHTVLTGQTPLVRHLHVVSHAQGTCDPGLRQGLTFEAIALVL